MMNSLEGLPVSENKGDITKTMMYASSDTGEYGNTSGAYINKYMKVSKYCGDTPGDCFGNEYYKYENNDRVSFDINTVKGACALLKNGVSVCLKPQIKQEGSNKEIIEGWIDLNGPKGPNIYGRDFRRFSINLHQRAAFTDDSIGDIIITDEPAPCEGGECKDNRDPCEIFPTGKACCTKEGHIVSGENDLCCRWFVNESENPNYLLCNPEVNPCDPTKENCDLNKCLNHTVTGPSDECCTILEVGGKPDPKCCTTESTSDYCCGLNPNTEACCEKKISKKGESALSANDACCKIKSIYNKYSFCQSACERDNNSKACCETIARRNLVTSPDDGCCDYDGVNGIDNSNKNVNNRNNYCCRLPENSGEQCCEWKYDHIGSDKDFYAKHDFNQTGGVFDACCHNSVRDIKYTEGKTDSKSAEVLKRCCTVNTPQPTEKEDELCCDYLVTQLGQDKLVHGQALRRCCKYEKWKNKPQCCSHDHDGMATQTYNVNVPWSSQCCMPNSIYNNDVTPHKDCCFAVPNAQGESGNIWKGKRYEGCCSYWDKSYNGTQINRIDQWQL
ncbi:hypothetical protein J6N69_05520, partial [bacterium]|nr:hypothetical protein [bacterium]